MLPRWKIFDQEPQKVGLVNIYYAEANEGLNPHLRLTGTVETLCIICWQARVRLVKARGEARATLNRRFFTCY
jgi:hypothetical protein